MCSWSWVRGRGRPAATLSCHSTRSCPVMASLTGCSTCAKHHPYSSHFASSANNHAQFAQVRLSSSMTHASNELSINHVFLNTHSFALFHWPVTHSLTHWYNSPVTHSYALVFQQHTVLKTLRCPFGVQCSSTQPLHEPVFAQVYRWGRISPLTITHVKAATLAAQNH